MPAAYDEPLDVPFFVEEDPIPVAPPAVEAEPEPEPEPEPELAASQKTVVRETPSPDTVERPTWLDPADAESEGSAPAAGDGS